MQQATINLPLGKATLIVPAEDAARILIEQFTQSSRKPAASLPKIGEYWPGQGGVYVGLMRGHDGQPDYHLIAAPGEAGFVKEITWGGYEKDEPDAKSEWDGKANTLALARSSIDHPAAEWAAGLEIDGHADWYLPARRESVLCYANTPELFEKAWYWTSTQCSPGGAWLQGFGDGGQDTCHKNDELRARAVRRFVHLPL
ncbi:DUF1566 domain-containing protein [Chromobacterium phragmitis]|uniref:DUF1566 domain-containing protein n=1 Tax=Chromobacterium amazonense TaxID=1382803 RepID=UPI0021B71F91|nr:DUF1566 domain-containing protein [Chromobacterium amazonense]MBM2883961.1 DUF1566 domain-containing protein [Chromobacterium amazonense]MDE1711878.1 DUF1566 domain-containing protein [Chromobacterium amazonense]